MSGYYRYSNKRTVKRVGGRFARWTAEDFGIGVPCPKCGTLTVRVYDGPPTGFVDPRAFRYRCYTCEPDPNGNTPEVGRFQVTP